MSRTRRGSKGCGYDFWSPRPYSGWGHGRMIKIICHRLERRRAKAAIYRGEEMRKREAF